MIGVMDLRLMIKSRSDGSVLLKGRREIEKLGRGVDMGS
jgi:hypothetical protein